MVTRCYNTCFALKDDDRYFMVDAGGGNQIMTILQDMKVDVTKIHDIFVTHEHNDHILGMVWMIRMIATKINQGSYEGDLRIYCYDGLINTIQTLCKLTIQTKLTKHFGERIKFIPVADGETKHILDYDITFFDIQSTKAKQFGFTLVLKNGKRFTCLGDENYHEQAEAAYVQDCDWLLHEAFCTYAERDIFKPYEKHHSTAKDACELAEKLGIKNLLLYHTEDKSITERKEKYTAEGAPYFHGKLWVPDDREIIEL